MGMRHKVQFVVFATLFALSCAALQGATPASVTGVVCDSAGVPQIGAVVQLLRPDLSVAASVYTSSTGRFAIASVPPGRYSLKAMNATFLPAMRENVRVRSNTVVNLTLSTLYEVMQWLPAEPRAANAQKDDWAWTLKSAANRPLLRWLEDGPLVVVSDGRGAAPKLKARIMATGEQGSFGENGERISASVEQTPTTSRQLLARVDFDPSSNGGMESLLGFRQDLGYAGAVQSMAAISIQPETDAGASQGLDEAAMRSTETISLGDEFDAEVGSEQVLARLNGGSSGTLIAALPFATVGWHSGDSTIRYRFATMLPAAQNRDESQPRAWLPALSANNGTLALQHGLHQELGWERRTDASGLSLSVFADHVDNPVLEAMSRMASGSDASSMLALFDSASELLRATGPDFSSVGMQASIEHRLPRGNHIRLSYANGNALVFSSTAATAQPVSLLQLIADAQPRHSQTYALSLSGTLDGTGTRWRATYRWQPEATLTAVAPFALDANDPYLNCHLRQPLRHHRNGVAGIDGVLDVRNLLAQGYRPYMLSDGSLLIFAQDQRSFRAGLAFTF